MFFLERNVFVSAGQVKTEIDKLAKSFPNTTPILLDIGRNMEELEKLVKGHDLVIRSDKEIGFRHYPSDVS